MAIGHNKISDSALPTLENVLGDKPLARCWDFVWAQVSIAVEGGVSTAAQLVTDRGFARAGYALDKNISLTHCPYLLDVSVG